jgi:hypothetical protein
LVVYGASVGIFRSAALGDAAPAPESSSPPINWRWVEDKEESTCSQVATTRRLLHETISVH